MINPSVRRSRFLFTLSLLLAATVPAARSRADLTGFGTTGTGSTLNSGSPATNNPTISNGALTLTETLTDTSTNGAPVTYSYDVGNLAGALGSTAYVGFTGGTGVLGSTQTISGFSFTSVPESAAWGPVVGGVLLLIAVARMRRQTRARV